MKNHYVNVLTDIGGFCHVLFINKIMTFITQYIYLTTTLNKRHLYPIYFSDYKL